MCEAPDHSQSVLPQNWGKTEPNCTVTRVALRHGTTGSGPRASSHSLLSLNKNGLEQAEVEVDFSPAHPCPMAGMANQWHACY
ncbi:hypothetical protein TNCV_5048441 [Trichonephila clavipes]|nr:hypothetical protein TNCV_5048441 [Trichonephila clavipes]